MHIQRGEGERVSVPTQAEGGMMGMDEGGEDGVVRG